MLTRNRLGSQICEAAALTPISSPASCNLSHKRRPRMCEAARVILSLWRCGRRKAATRGARKVCEMDLGNLDEA
jgi:hypothetical protein